MASGASWFTFPDLVSGSRSFPGLRLDGALWGWVAPFKNERVRGTSAADKPSAIPTRTCSCWPSTKSKSSPNQPGRAGPWIPDCRKSWSLHGRQTGPRRRAGRSAPIVVVAVFLSLPLQGHDKERSVVDPRAAAERGARRESRSPFRSLCYLASIASKAGNRPWERNSVESYVAHRVAQSPPSRSHWVGGRSSS